MYLKKELVQLLEKTNRTINKISMKIFLNKIFFKIDKADRLKMIKTIFVNKVKISISLSKVPIRSMIIQETLYK